MKHLPILCLFVILIATSSCQQRMYFADRVNAPGLTKANDLKLTLSAKINGNSGDNSNDSGVKKSVISPAVDVSYAVTDHFGIMASYRSLLNRYIREEQDGVFTSNTIMGGVFNGHRFEGGAGYFTTFGGKGKFETYGGIGAGKIERKGPRYPEYDYESKYFRYFIQPAIGVDANDKFSVAGGIRLTMQHFYDFKSADPLFKYNIATLDDPDNGHDVTKPLYAFIEPFINMEVGYRFLKFNMQVSGTFPLSKYGSGLSGNTPVAFYLGLTFLYSQGFFGGKQ